MAECKEVKAELVIPSAEWLLKVKKQVSSIHSVPLFGDEASQVTNKTSMFRFRAPRWAEKMLKM